MHRYTLQQSEALSFGTYQKVKYISMYHAVCYFDSVMRSKLFFKSVVSLKMALLFSVPFAGINPALGFI